MKKKPIDKRLLCGGGALLFVILAACANYMAGVVFFLSYKENPAKAEFSTIQAAYASAPDAATMKKIRLSVGTSMLVCFLLPFAIVMHLRSRPRGHDLYGTSSFADRKDIQREKLDAEVGVVLGKFKKKLLRLSGYEFVLLAAPTRTGKGIGFCIPNLLQFQGSAVVLDIKGENYNLTSEFRRRYMANEIIYFNPFSENSTRWNPLSYVSSDPSYRANDLLGIAAIIYPVNDKEPFWANAAKNLFLGLALLVLETPQLPKTMGEILRQGSGKGSSIEDYLAHVLAVRAASATPLSETCIDSLNRFLGSGEDSLKGILATFSAALTPFANDVIDKATAGDDFDLRDVRKRKMTIYLAIPAAEMSQAAFIVNLFFSQLIKENVKELPENNPELKHQCLLMLDEFTAMGKVDIIAKGVGFMAGYNMRLAIIIQDKSQLDSVYGKEDAHNIVSNMGAVIYFTPSQIDEAEQFSKMIGNNTVLTDSRQRSKGQLFGLKGSSGDSSTESFQSRAVMLPQELLSMSKDIELIVRPGIPVIKADKIRYFTEPYFKERFNAVPMQEVTIGDEKRTVPIPARLPKGEWQSYRASLASSGYYRTQTAPAAPPDAGAGAAGAAGAGASPLPLNLAKADFPPAEKPATDYALPTLPASYIPYCSLHALLSTPMPPTQPSTHAAFAYAESIIRYWQMYQSTDDIDDDQWLPIVDLSAGSGQFAWQLINALFERMATMNLSLSPFRYVACVDDEQQQRALQSHPYFAAATDAGHFVATTRAAFANGDDASYAANPCVVIGNGSLRELPHELLAVRGGELLRINSKVTGTPGPQDRQLKLDHQQLPLQADTLPASGAAVAEMYRGSLTSGVVLLPGGALGLLDQVSRLTDGKFLLLSVDKAVNDEREIRLGAFPLPTQVTVPLPGMPTNYHALERHLNSHGAQVWQESILDSDLCFLVALCDENNGSIVGGLAELVAPVVSAHSGAEQRSAALAQRQLLTLPDCLSLLQRTNYDPRIFEELYPHLRAADWTLSRVAMERWQQAMARCWAQYLPLPKTVDFYSKLVTLARRAGHLGLVRDALRTGVAYFGETVDDLCQIADCELVTGNTQAAQTALHRALTILPEHAAATGMMREVERRLEHEKTLAWFRAAPQSTRGLRLEPLSPHHAEQLHFQYRDPRISMLTMLPALDSVEKTRLWIETESALKGNMNCAVMHEHWGLVGFCSAQRSGDDAYFSFWIGVDYQRYGYGRLAAVELIDMLRRCGLRSLFAASFQDNEAARRTLNSIGFERMDVAPKSPYESLYFSHLGLDENQENTREQLDKLCAALAIPVEFEASQPARVKEESKRSR